LKKLQKICIAFLGNFYFDTRTYNFYTSLSKNGFDVSVISFSWQNNKKSDNKNVKVIQIKRHPSILFYFKFAVRTLINLFSFKADIYIADDIYTLPFIVIAGKIFHAKIIYDSREVYMHLAGLKQKKLTQNFIRAIEKFFIRYVDLTLAVGELDRIYIQKYYDLLNTLVIRNLPLCKKPDNAVDYRKMFNLPADSKIIVYQGMILHGRGLKIILPILDRLDNAYLVIIGDGDQKEFYESLTEELKLNNKVFFIGLKTQNELTNFTAGADMGLSIIEDLSLSYYYALPNKLFEYVMAEVPVIVSNMPQMKEIVDKYHVGVCVNHNDSDEITKVINYYLQNEKSLLELKENCKKASEELCWEKEIESLLDIIKNWQK
jgi:glycosyltransferase involved in cell wall biosynthesis